MIGFTLFVKKLCSTKVNQISAGTLIFIRTIGEKNLPRAIFPNQLFPNQQLIDYDIHFFSGYLQLL